ncbi:carbohydrate kinase family protein [Occallatibacter riparius]|uniref:PfkB family carbohydrate kinase n=1 Tax=Occallatibacter riparius TaxID=1002689 RepID=A0A9J7BVA1_9BACT|nr:PfkB family carbohydrate kinase [Occallatibacter riparius]UWZ85706.1 PfkB family carbohydrate kinase [Occallatibacter riparius]
MPELSVVDLVGVGLNATDTLIPLDEFPARGSKVEFAPVPLMPGGQTASAVIACQSWGLSTRYVGKLGDDDAARLHAHEFARLGVDARLIEVANAASPQSIIIVDGGGERTVIIRRDDRLQLTASDIQREWIVNARSLLVDGIEAEAATQAAQWAHDAGVPVIADLDEEYDGGDELLACVDYLIVSRDFPVHMTGEHDLARALRILRNEYSCKLTAATLGQDGVIAWDGERLLHRAAYRVPVVDTTGAGDIFHAGFIYGLLQSWPLERQLDFACAAAALNCTCSGARGGIRTVADVEKLMAHTPRYETAIIP